MVMDRVGDDGKLHTNWGTVVAIAIFIVAQSIAGVWWAATITAQFEALKDDVKETNSQMNERITFVDQNRISDRQRLFDRLVAVEKIANELSAATRANNEIVSAVKEDIAALRSDLKENNSLLRDLLLSVRPLDD